MRHNVFFVCTTRVYGARARPSSFNDAHGCRMTSIDGIIEGIMLAPCQGTTTLSSPVRLIKTTSFNMRVIAALAYMLMACIRAR
jgi:hypothetical protein